LFFGLLEQIAIFLKKIRYGGEVGEMGQILSLVSEKSIALRQERRTVRESRVSGFDRRLHYTFTLSRKLKRIRLSR